MVRAPALSRLLLLLLAAFPWLSCSVEKMSTEGPSAAVETLHPLPSLRQVTHSAEAPAVGRLLLISEESLWMVHPGGGQIESIELPAAVCGLAVHGRRAAVSHEGFLTLIDLESRAIERILQIRLPCGEVALTEQYAYLLIQVLSRQQVIQIPLAGGPPQTTEVGFFSIGCRLTLHPSDDAIYVACNDSVGRIGLDAQGRVDPQTSFETRLDRELGCNRMWVTDDWAYAACGARLRRRTGLPRDMSSRGVTLAQGRGKDEISDLSPSGRLPMRGVASMCEAAGFLAVIPAQFSPYRVHNGLNWGNPHLLDENGGRTLELLRHPDLHPLASLPLPSLPSGEATRGQAVFCGLREGHLQVLVRGDASLSYGLWSVPTPPLH